MRGENTGKKPISFTAAGIRIVIGSEAYDAVTPHFGLFVRDSFHYAKDSKAVDAFSLILNGVEKIRDTIDKTEEFLVFDLARNGLRIQDKNGKYDLFILADIVRFKKMLVQTMHAL